MSIKIRKLEFVNKRSKSASVSMLVEDNAIAEVMKWYGAYHAGDRYTVKVDDVTVRKDRNGELAGKLPAGQYRYMVS